MSSLNLEKLEEQLEPLNMSVSFVFQEDFEYYEQPLFVTTIKYEGNETCQVNVTIPPTRYPWHYYKYFFLNPLVKQVNEYFDTTNIFALYDVISKASSLAQSFFVNFIVLLLAADMISGFLGGYSIIFSLPWLKKYTIYTTAYVVVSALASALQILKTLHLFIELRASTKFSAELKRIAQEEFKTPFKYLPPPLKWQVTKLALEKVLMRFDRRVRKVAIYSYPLYKALKKLQEYRAKEGVPGLIKVMRDYAEVRSLYKYGVFSVVSSRLYETLDKFYRVFSLSSPLYRTYLEIEASKRVAEKVKETRRGTEERVKETIERLRRTPLYERVLKQKYSEMMPLKGKTVRQFIDLVSKDLGVKVNVKFTAGKVPIRARPDEVVVNLDLEGADLFEHILYNLVSFKDLRAKGLLEPKDLMTFNRAIRTLRNVLMSKELKGLTVDKVRVKGGVTTLRLEDLVIVDLISILGGTFKPESLSVLRPEDVATVNKVVRELRDKGVLRPEDLTVITRVSELITKGTLNFEDLITVNKTVSELRERYLPLFLTTVRPLDLTHVEAMLSPKEILRVAKSREVLTVPDKIEEFILRMSQAYVFSTPEKSIVAEYFIDDATVNYIYDLRRIFEERGRVDDFDSLLDVIWRSYDSGRDYITRYVQSLKDDVLISAVNVLQPHVAMMWMIKSDLPDVPSYVYTRGLVEVARLSRTYGLDMNEMWARVVEREFKVTADDKFIMRHHFDWAKVMRDARELTKLESPPLEMLEDLERRVNQLLILADREGAHELKHDLLKMLNTIRKYIEGRSAEA